MATATRYSGLSKAGLPSTRMVEWSILAVVILVIAFVAGRYALVLRGQAERSAVLSTLGALRTGLVIAHLQAASGANAVSPSAPEPNPFAVLRALPLNYRGEFSVVEAVTTRPGGWVFDPLCACVGYVPLDGGWSDDASKAGALWFKVASGPGPRQLTAQGTYTWRGVMVQ